MTDLTVRPARLDEAKELTQLMQRSKAYWGYDEAFMTLFRSELQVTAEAIREGIVYVLVRDGERLGYYRFLKPEGKLLLEDLFIEPDTIGKGYGKMLFQHAVSVARELGFGEFTFDSDPNAEAFYLHLGAERVSQRESRIKGRFIPQMIYRIPE